MMGVQVVEHARDFLGDRRRFIEHLGEREQRARGEQL
jgi:hypothetical protein